MKSWRTVVLLGLVLMTIAAPHVAAAQTSGGLIKSCDQAVIGPDGTVTSINRCGIDDFVNQFVVLGQYGITIVVFIAALMLVYGGFEFITAGGRQSKISSGQNIITGTVIGLIISFSAYVIINFAVGAITGTATSKNPFTAIATVFSGKKLDQTGTNLNRPFSGDGAAAANNCRVEWDTTCADQILCADPADQGTSGSIATQQSRLNGFGCGCGTIDGCFGEQTMTCVRRFQIANDITPSGTIDESTYNAMNQTTPQHCDTPANAAKITSTLAALPKPTANVASVSTGNSGCCVVKKDAATPLYCIEALDERACAALGSDYIFANDQRCSESTKTNQLCGFCQSTTGTCFQQTGQYWCQNVAHESNSTTPLTFNKGACLGLTPTICGGGCDTTLKTSP